MLKVSSPSIAVEFSSWAVVGLSVTPVLPMASSMGEHCTSGGDSAKLPYVFPIMVKLKN